MLVLLCGSVQKIQIFVSLKKGSILSTKAQKWNYFVSKSIFQEVLSALQNVEHIELNLSDNEIEPCLIRVSTEKIGCLVIMPMRLTFRGYVAQISAARIVSRS